MRPPDAPDRHRESFHTPGIEEFVACRLRRSPYSALRGIDCSYRDGVLTLRGCLPTHYLKQLAQEAGVGVEGVRAVVNQIEVLTSEAPRGRIRSRGPVEAEKHPGSSGG